MSTQHVLLKTKYLEIELDERGTCFDFDFCYPKNDHREMNTAAERVTVEELKEINKNLTRIIGAYDPDYCISYTSGHLSVDNPAVKKEREDFAKELLQECTVHALVNAKNLSKYPGMVDESRARELAALLVEDILNARNITARG